VLYFAGGGGEGILNGELKSKSECIQSLNGAFKGKYYVFYGCAPRKGGAFQWVQVPSGDSRKQPEQTWR
jgi:hypothetical protein